MIYRVELRDRDFNIIETLDNKAFNIGWNYDRFGGCSNFDLSLNYKFDAPKALSGFYDIRIKKQTAPGTYSLLYSGYIEEKRTTLAQKEGIKIDGIGYQGQLEHVIVDTTYSSEELSAIIKDILDTYVTPNTDISYDAGDIESTGFTADTLEFKTNALNAIKTIIDIAGTWEWGVDENRKFYFKERSSSVGYRFTAGKDIEGYNPVFEFKDIINKLYFEGGDVSGNKYTTTGNHAKSQAKYGIIEDIEQNSAITTATVADQLIDSIFSSKSDLDIKASLSLQGYEEQIESTLPIDLVEMVESGIRYGEEYYGTFLYQAYIQYRINNISYNIDKTGNLEVSIDMGKGKTSLAKSIDRLKYELEQLRQARS